MLDLTKCSSVGSALSDALEQFSGELCLIETDHGRERERLTYRAFKERAQPFAAALQEGGFKSGDRAAIIMTNQSKWLISAYAIFRCGGVLVPLAHYLPAQEHWQMLKHAGAQLVITEYPIWERMSKVRDRAPNVQTVLVTEAPASADLVGVRRWEDFRSSEEPALRSRERNDIACIVYSSGTIGQPKGCMMTHENYLEQCMALTSIFRFAPGIRYLSVLPTNHAIDFMVGFFGPFICGATVVHLRSVQPAYIRQAFTTYKINYVSVVPMILQIFERSFRDQFKNLSPFRQKLLNCLIWANRQFTRDRPRLWLSRLLLKRVHQAFGGKLRAIIVGGSFSPPAMLQFFYDLGVPVANGYGMTEAGTAITLNDLKPFRSDSVGKPLPGVDIRIVDPDQDGNGEVQVLSKTVMAGYMDDPELTALTIIDGWLKTGDFGRIDGDGRLHLVGRKKNMVIAADGKNVYPEEIELAFETLPMPVLESCVLGAGYIWPGQSKLEDDHFVLVLHLESGSIYTEGLRRELLERNRSLPPHKRIRSVLLANEEFPRTPQLKIMKSALASTLEALDSTNATIRLEQSATAGPPWSTGASKMPLYVDKRICGRCQTYVPDFPELSEESKNNFKKLLRSGVGMVVVFELRRKTCCSIPAAMKWARHANCPVESPALCPYCGGLLRTKRAQQCCHCFRDWHAKK